MLNNKDSKIQNQLEENEQNNKIIQNLRNGNTFYGIVKLTVKQKNKSIIIEVLDNFYILGKYKDKFILEGSKGKTLKVPRNGIKVLKNAKNEEFSKLFKENIEF